MFHVAFRMSFTELIKKMKFENKQTKKTKTKRNDRWKVINAEKYGEALRFFVLVLVFNRASMNTFMLFVSTSSFEFFRGSVEEDFGKKGGRGKEEI